MAAGWTDCRGDACDCGLRNRGDECLRPDYISCVDAQGVTTAGVMGDIRSARIQARGALTAVNHGVVRHTPFVQSLGRPVFCAIAHPSTSGRDLVPVDYDTPVNMA